MSWVCVILYLKKVIIQSDDYESEESKDDRKVEISQQKSDTPVPEIQVATPDDSKLVDKWIL